MLFAGSSLDRAREIFAAEVKRRPRLRLTLRQRSQVLQEVARRKRPLAGSMVKII
jgi:hypothetical protein